MGFNLMDLISVELVSLLVAIYVIGMFLKWSRVKDSFIPWILMAISIILSSIILKDFVQGIIQGILVVGIDILGSQLYIQTVRKRD